MGRFGHVRSFFTKRWVWACLGVGAALAIGAACISGANYHEPAQFTPGSLVQQYLANDLATSFTYEDKPVIVSGVVEESGAEKVSPMGDEVPFLVLSQEDSDDPAFQVKAYFRTEDQQKAIDGIENGEAVSIQGTLLGYGIIPMLDSCSII